MWFDVQQKYSQLWQLCFLVRIKIGLLVRLEGVQISIKWHGMISYACIL